MQLNTLFQLYAHVREGLPKADGAPAARARPDRRAAVRPPRSRSSPSGRPRRCSTAPPARGTPSCSGAWAFRPEPALRRGPVGHHPRSRCSRTSPPRPGSHGVHVVVAGAPTTRAAPSRARRSRPGWAYISSGTWSLAGVERHRRPRSTTRSRATTSPTKAACSGTTRFLKNVMGLWILESCRREWKDRGETVDYDGLLQARSRHRWRARPHLPGRPAVPEPPEHAGRHRRSRCAEIGPGGSRRTRPPWPR